MTWLRVLALRFRGMLAKGRQDAELDAELQSHLEMLAEENVQRGMSAEEARRAAKIALGGVERIKEAVRDQRGLPLLESLVADVRFGLRMLRKNPGFTVVAVITVALGIGTNTAIFTVVDNVLLRPLPYPEAQRIVKIGTTFRGDPGSNAVIEGSHYRFLEENSRSFEFVELHDVVTSGVNLSGGAQPEHLVSASVSSGFFSVLGVAPALGRTFTEEEDTPGGPCAMVLTNGLWHSRYAGDPAVVGRSVTVDEQGCLITGVLPASFRFDQNAQIFMPLRIPAVPERGHYFYMLARLKPGVTIAQARTEMPSIFSLFKAAHGDLVDSSETGIQVKPYLDWIVGDVRTSLWALFGAVSLVLLIACVNVANLLLARAAARDREIAVRIALGAGRRRLTRQMVTEGTLLAIAGGALGLLMARWGIAVLHRMAPSNLPRAGDISLDLRVMGFGFLLSAVTVLVFGLAPAWRATGVDINASLQAASGRGSADAGAARGSSLLIGVEVALSVILLVGAALLMRSFVALRGVNAGFDAENVLTFKMSPSRRYASTSVLWGFERQVLDQIRALPGVETAAVAICLPMELGPDMPSEILGQATVASPLNSHYRTVSPEYFRTLRIPIIRGRPFGDSDATDSTPVIMALGAERSDVLKMIIGKGLRPALTGVIIGVGGALALTRFLTSALYGVSPKDPLTLAGVALAAAGVALLACWIPARRAARVDPMAALRHE